MDTITSCAYRPAGALWAARAHGHGYRYCFMVQPRCEVRLARHRIGFEEAVCAIALRPGTLEGEYCRVLGVIERCRWNMPQAAAELKLSCSALYRRLRQLRIQRPTRAALDRS